MGKVLLALKGAGIEERISRPRGFRCSRKARRTAPARPRSSATAPAIGSRIRLRDVTKVAGVIDTLVSARRQRCRRRQFHGV